MKANRMRLVSSLNLIYVFFLLTTLRRTAAFTLCTSSGSGRRWSRNVLHGTATDEASYIATCIPGLSGILMEELEMLGCKNVFATGSSAAIFSADSKTALSTVLWSRTAHKIMELLVSTTTATATTSATVSGGHKLMRDRNDIYDFVRKHIPVKSLLGDGRGGLLTISVQVILNSPGLLPNDINHSHFTALTIKNALCDEVRDLRGDRPSVDLENPDVPLVAILLGCRTPTGQFGAHLSIYRQIHSAGSLHRRGYRQSAAIHKAALKETLAAGILLYTEWSQLCKVATPSQPAILIDPMAGSGSLLIEAAMIASDLAPGLMRIKCKVPGSQSPPFLRWKHDGHDSLEALWRELLTEASQRAKLGLQKLKKSPDGRSVCLIGNDIHKRALDLMISSLESAGMHEYVETYVGDCRDWNPIIPNKTISNMEEVAPPPHRWMIVTNPPWGIRLSDDMHDSWEALRVFVRDRCPSGSELWILSGNKESTKHLGLRRSQSLPIKTGDQDLRWIRYILGRDALLNAMEDSSDKRRFASKSTSDVIKPKWEISASQPRKQKKTRVKDRNINDNEWLI